MVTLPYAFPVKTQRQSIPTGGRPLRADAERTMTAILEAAERTLSRDPAATMEQIAEAAGVARTTVHRRFATREALIDALAVWAAQRFAAAVDAAHPDTAPPLVALYQTTANVLGIKASWGFAMSRGSSANPEVARVHSDVRDTCERLFRRAGSPAFCVPTSTFHGLVGSTTPSFTRPHRTGTGRTPTPSRRSSWTPCSAARAPRTPTACDAVPVSGGADDQDKDRWQDLMKVAISTREGGPSPGRRGRRGAVPCSGPLNRS